MPEPTPEVPTTDAIRNGYARYGYDEQWDDWCAAEFDRWLAAHDAQVRAETATVSAEALEHLFRSEFKASPVIATMMANAVLGLLGRAS